MWEREIRVKGYLLGGNKPEGGWVVVTVETEILSLEGTKQSKKHWTIVT